MDIIGSGDWIVAPFKRAGLKWKRAKLKVKRRLNGTSTRRGNDRIVKTHRGHKQTTLTPAMRKAAPGRQAVSRQQADLIAQAVVRAQRQSTAAKPVRCQRCKGVYGALKSTPGRPRAHKDLTSGRPCPGGGAPPKARK